MLFTFTLDPARRLLQGGLANIIQDGFRDAALHFNVTSIKDAGPSRCGRVVFHVPVSRHIVKVGRLVVV
jgi:hypothetical protein